MTLSDIERKMEISQIAWLMCIYIVRRDSLWEEADYISYEDYAQRRWGVSRRQADYWASYGEILCDLYPALAPGAEATDLGTNCSLPASAGRPGAGLAPGRLRPLVSLKRSGFTPDDVRDVWMGIMTHTTEPTERQVHTEVVKHKRESLKGMYSPEGATVLRRMIALHVYDLVRAESESDELAVLCREAITNVLQEFGEQEPAGRHPLRLRVQ
jgi:hypothetical protein